MVDSIREELDFVHLQELDKNDRGFALSALEQAAMGSGVSTPINGVEVKIVDGAKKLEGDSMDVKDAYENDPDSMLTSKGFLLNPTAGQQKVITGVRMGKKVGGTIGIFGIEGALASLQGVQTGLILADTDENSRVNTIKVFLALNDKQVKPETVGADKWRLTPTWAKILEPVKVEKNGTMVFKATPGGKK